MSVDMFASELLVKEYSGTARGGKGSIVSDLAEYDPLATSDETGADYRTLTRVLLDEETLDPIMPPEVITKVVNGIGSCTLAEIVAERQAIVDARGFDSLYHPDVNDMVPQVAAVPLARAAVKDGFAERIRKVRDGGEHQVLLVDGRNLEPVIRSVPGTRLVMRTFVTCTPEEAALRECTRNKIDLGTPEGLAFFGETRNSVALRNERDAERAVDPVRPEDGAIDYWQEGQCEQGKFGVLSGVAALACTSGNQIYFDTTPYRGCDDSKDRMLAASRHMYDEAKEVRGALAGLY